MKKIVVITGANGLIGNRLCQEFVRRGWQVRAGVRRPGEYAATHPDVTPFQCALPDSLDQTAFDGADVCIHAAYATRATTRERARRVNEDGTLAVLSASRRAAVYFVFISSCSAHEAARSDYGRSKLALEKKIDLQRDLVLRPGLVLGKQGLFGRMVDSIRRSRLIPIFDGGRQSVQTIHIADLCAAIVRAVERRLTGRLILAEAESICMRDLLAAIAQKLGKRAIFISVPATPALVALRVAEGLRLPLPVSSDNLLGLRSMVYQDPTADLARLGISLRSARQSLDDLL
ncbi:MAG TPA: NAD-dependent epimerase/dehydratase family protein [Candidatus Acidoferrum sp.]|nr:NAD-dependent epimerase/dehydratase family protein [Candidatus Acidoferrum sp.]